MEINEEILEIFKEFKIFPDDGICYLISLFYGLKPTYIPKELMKKINTTKIYEEKNKSIHWNIPLFKNQSIEFQWVKSEYVKLFKEANVEKGGNIRESISRMKKLFAKHPEIRKHEVIEATKLYLYNTDSKYIRKPHYFIEKGQGANKISDILDWIDKYRDSQLRNDNDRNKLK